MSSDILILNDYCLLEIFKHLSVIDLANFKEVCGTVAADMEFTRMTRGSFFFGCKDKMDNALQIIKQFGELIKDLTINYHAWYEREWSEIFSVINEHCNETLKSLTLCGDAVGLITNADILLIVDVLNNLEALELRNLNYEVRTNYTQDFVNILPYCVNAKSIELISYIDIDVKSTLFQSNKVLSKLKLRGLSDLSAIVDGLMNTQLEEFVVSSIKKDVSSFYENYSQLSRLGNLKRLCIDCWYTDVSPVVLKMNDFSSLSVLSLSNAELDLKILKHLTRLKVLKLRNSCCSTTNFPFESVVLLCGIEHFEHLILLCYREPIVNSNFLKIIENRKMGTNRNRLHLALMNGVYVETLKSIPFEMLEAHKETIMLIDDNDPNYEYYSLDRDKEEC